MKKLKIETIKIGEVPETASRELFNIVIEPKPTSPNDRMNIRLLSRSTDEKKIVAFTNDLEKLVENIIKSLGGPKC